MTAYPMQLFHREDGNLVQKDALNEDQEKDLRKSGFYPLGEGPFKDPSQSKKK